MTKLCMQPYRIPAAEVGVENPLPQFRKAQESGTFSLNANIPEDDRRYMGWKTNFRVLPHRMQDGYTRQKTERDLPSAVLENEHVRATFLVGLGGRLASLYDKRHNRELLDRNPVFQPANLALRNAWFSGGIEWNAGGIPGHHCLTCSPVFAARIETPDGPALRLYEWDRSLGFPWQIDFHLPQDSPFLYVHVLLINPHDVEIPMYWWSNIATPEREGARVLFPADTAIGFCGGGEFGVIDLPTTRGFDATYSTSVPYAQEMFARIGDGQRRWVAHLDKEGKGFFQTSTDRLRGRKMFCWGMNQGGRRWQEFLSTPGNAYIEIQAGLARTQLECVPMPAREEWAWTEAYGYLEADASKVHGQAWQAAWQAADAAIEHVLPLAEVERLHEAFRKDASLPPAEILHRGSGWGMLERRRLAKQGKTDSFPAATPFSEADMGADQAMWLMLLDGNALPERDPRDEPGAMMVQPEWRELLDAALRERRGDHWLAWYHLGVMRMDAQNAAGAEEAWNRSIERHPSGWAYRNLAVLKHRAGDAVAHRQLLCRAWETGPKVAALGVEYARVLVEQHDYDAMGALLESMPDEVRHHERIRIMAAQAAIEHGSFDEVEALFDYDFATVREGEVTLTDLWFAYHERRMAAKNGTDVNDEIRKRVRKEFPPPARIDFRMAGSD